MEDTNWANTPEREGYLVFAKVFQMTGVPSRGFTFRWLCSVFGSVACAWSWKAVETEGLAVLFATNFEQETNAQKSRLGE